MFDILGIVYHAGHGHMIAFGQVPQHMVRTYLVALVGWIRNAVRYEQDVAVAHNEIYFLIFGPSQSAPDCGNFCQRLAANCLLVEGLPT